MDRTQDLGLFDLEDSLYLFNATDGPSHNATEPPPCGGYETLPFAIELGAIFIGLLLFVSGYCLVYSAFDKLVSRYKVSYFWGVSFWGSVTEIQRELLAKKLGLSTEKGTMTNFCIIMGPQT